MIGAEIRKARKAHGWTQVQLAQAIGTQQSVISDIENGDRMPNTATLERIAAALGLTLSVQLLDPKGSAASSGWTRDADAALVGAA